MGATKTETTVKAVNYTAEQTAELVNAYKASPTSETVDAMATKFGKNRRSIIAKLTRERVYVKAEYTGKTGQKPVFKDATADKIGELLRMNEGDITSLTKANKSALVAILNALIACTVNGAGETVALSESMA